MFFLSNTAAITDSADKAVADMHETIHAGLDSLFTLRKVAREFPRKNGAREVAWPTCPDFARFRETFLTTFDKMTDVNIGAESRLGCLQELAGMELVFLGKTF
jgi:hypothetical protein